MTALPEIHPVVEAPWYEGSPPWPWRIADCPPFSFIRVSGAMTEAEVGSVIAQLVTYNHIDAGPGVGGLLSGAIAAESLVLPGGLQVTAGERVISPSCCCGLEKWREWWACVESGQSPWMGHDPAPGVEWVDGIARVWSDGFLDRVPDAFAIEIDRARFVAELDRVERDLHGFLLRVEAWANGVGYSAPQALCRKLNACFSISGPTASEQDAYSPP